MSLLKIARYILNREMMKHPWGSPTRRLLFDAFREVSTVIRNREDPERQELFDRLSAPPDHSFTVFRIRRSTWTAEVNSDGAWVLTNFDRTFCDLSWDRVREILLTEYDSA